MEEIDSLILHSLKLVGCDIEDGISLTNLMPDQVIEGVSRCLHVIDDNIPVTRHLPPSMAIKFRIGAVLAEGLKKIGYPGEVGYQTFLYSNALELRKIFMFLTEQLPKESDASVETELESPILAQLRCEVARQMKLPWAPPTVKGIPVRYDDKTADVCCRGIGCYYSTHFPFIIKSAVESSTGKESHLLRSLHFAEHLRCQLDAIAGTAEHSSLRPATSDPAWNSRENKSEEHSRKPAIPVKPSVLGKPIISEKPAISNKPSAAVLEKNEGEVVALKQQLTAIQRKYSSIQEKITRVRSAKDEMEKRRRYLQETNPQLSEDVMVEERVASLIDEAPEKINVIQSHLELLNDKTVRLGARVLERSNILNEEVNELAKIGPSEETMKRQEIEEIQSAIQALIEQVHLKQALEIKLTQEVEKMSQDVVRSVYTRRILEIIQTIKKESKEIDKILGDTRELQKSINFLSGKLDRTYTVTDELLFKDALKDDSAKKAYKLLANLHENFNLIQNAVKANGIIIRETWELNEQVENEKAKNVAKNLEELKGDYLKVKQENRKLIKQFKERQSH